jgi:hypothetical protein
VAWLRRFSVGRDLLPGVLELFTLDQLVQTFCQFAKKASPAVLFDPVHHFRFQPDGHLGCTTMGLSRFFRVDSGAAHSTGLLLPFAPHPLVVHGAKAAGDSLPITVFF